MRVALYFDEDIAYAKSLTATDLVVASTIVAAVPEHRRHVTISSGTLPQYKFARNDASLVRVVDGLLGKSIPAWTTIQSTELKEILSKIDVVAFVIDGLIPQDAREIHRLLIGTIGYLGAIEALPSEEICWALYNRSLPARGRIVGKELRIFYSAAEYEAGGDRDGMSMTAYRESQLFEQVLWEDTGVRNTVFDPYTTFEYAQVAADVSQLVNDQMAGVVNEVCLRLVHLDPRLMTYLHGAFKAFERLDTDEALAHAALSCRRLIENLSNALYPPREGKVNNRLVGKAEYRNRLWAYIQENLESNSQREVVLSTLQDVGNRLDKLDAVANSGLHSNIGPIETRRLLVGVTSLIYDLLTLTDPPTTTPDAPYNEYAQKLMRNMLRE